LKESILLLIETQVLDDRLVVLDRRLNSLRGELGEGESRVSVLEAEAEDADGERKACLARARDIENDLLIDEARAIKWEDESNRMRDVGSAEIARQKVQTLRDKIAGEEEEALSLLEKAEVLVGRIQEAKETLKEASVEFQTFRTTVKEDQKTLEEEQANVVARKSVALDSVAMEARAAYEKLVDSRNGQPLAVIRGSSCTGCGMTVPPNDMGRAMGLTGLVACRSCSRILIPDRVWKEATGDGDEAAGEGSSEG
jgi:predicted  nucleic acid-binding Zn-ribbon protein